MLDGCSAVSYLSPSAACSDGMALDLYLPLIGVATRQLNPGNCTLYNCPVWHQAICALMMHMCYALCPVIGPAQSILFSVLTHAFPSAHVGYMLSNVLIRSSHLEWHPVWVLTRLHVCVQVENMTNKHHVYMTKDGRISLAGLNKAKSEYLAKAIDDSVRNC